VTSIARTGRIDHLSAGLCHSDDFPAIKKRIAAFMAAGFLALNKIEQGPAKTETVSKKRGPHEQAPRGK
jgi:hypothetical protein